MKRDMDFIRELLLKIEELDKPQMRDLIDSNSSEEEVKSLQHHMKMLIDDVQFARGTSVGHSSFSPDWINIELTWEGNEYLDNIRDPEIWKKTKEGAKKIGGFSVEIFGELAKGFIREKIKKHTGTDIDL